MLSTNDVPHEATQTAAQLRRNVYNAALAMSITDRMFMWSRHTYRTLLNLQYSDGGHASAIAKRLHQLSERLECVIIYSSGYRMDIRQELIEEATHGTSH